MFPKYHIEWVLFLGLKLTKSQGLYCWEAVLLTQLLFPSQKLTKSQSFILMVVGEGSFAISKFCHRFAFYRGTQVDHKMVSLANKSTSGDHKYLPSTKLSTHRHPVAFSVHVMTFQLYTDTAVVYFHWNPYLELGK